MVNNIKNYFFCFSKINTSEHLIVACRSKIISAGPGNSTQLLLSSGLQNQGHSCIAEDVIAFYAVYTKKNKTKTLSAIFVFNFCPCVTQIHIYKAQNARNLLKCLMVFKLCC